MYTLPQQQPHQRRSVGSARGSGYLHNQQESHTGTNKPSMAAAMSPAVSLRFSPYSALRLITRFPKKLPLHILFPPIPRRHSSDYFRRSFRTAVSAALSSGEATGKTKPEVSDVWKASLGEKVGEFRKKLRISEVKGGLDEGLDRVGQTLIVKGWVRTLRVQSSVTFMEVRSGYS